MNETVFQKIDSYFTQFKHQVYKVGEILIRADDDPQGIFYLKQGVIKKYAISKKGDELILNMFKPPSFFPMSWAINNTQNNYFYEAVTEAEVWRAPKEKTLEFTRNNPDVLFDLVSRIYNGIDAMELRMTYLMSGSAYGRVITEILIYIRRFGEDCSPQDLGEKSVPHSHPVKVTIHEKELAAQSGLTRETISREIKILKGKGLAIFSRNVLIVPDLHMLEHELYNS